MNWAINGFNFDIQVYFIGRNIQHTDSVKMMNQNKQKNSEFNASKNTVNPFVQEILL